MSALEAVSADEIGEKENDESGQDQQSMAAAPEAEKTARDAGTQENRKHGEDGELLQRHACDRSLLDPNDPDDRTGHHRGAAEERPVGRKFIELVQRRKLAESDVEILALEAA